MASKNLVSQPPLTTPMTNEKGILTKAWSIWFRDMYSRTSYNGDNAIDINAEAIESNTNAIFASLQSHYVLASIDNLEKSISTLEQENARYRSFFVLLEEMRGKVEGIEQQASPFNNSIIDQLLSKINDVEQIASSQKIVSTEELITGPKLSTDNILPRFDGITGKILQESGITVDDSDNVSGITNLGLTGIMGFGVNGQLTISAGVVTITKSWHKIETEAAAGTDDLDTISGGTDGDILVIKAHDSTHTVVVRDNGVSGGNIQLDAGVNFSMTDGRDRLLLLKDGSDWYELSRTNN